MREGDAFGELVIEHADQQPFSTVPSAPRFYRIESKHISLREYAWGTPLPLMPLAALLKLCGVNLPSSGDDPPVHELTPFECAELSESERIVASPLFSELSAMGFSAPLHHEIIDPSHSTRIAWTTLRHASGKAFARIQHRMWSYGKRVRDHLFVVFGSELADGRFVISSSGKADMLAPPAWIVNRMEKAAPAALWEAHQKLLEKEGEGVRLIPDQAALREVVNRSHAVIRDFHLGRRVFAEPSGDDKELMKDVAEQAKGAGLEPSFDEIAALVEVRRAERAHSNWRSLLVILFVSLALFIGIGAAKQPLRFILLLVPILFLHEMGHFLAMKIFGYHNVRMFFIPFLGAAVSGRHYNQPGWKLAVVALAGPLPGVALGAVLGLVGVVTKNEIVNESALLLLIINGFNLLPLMPLDGGRVAHAVLFCRHPVFDVISRSLAVAALALLGILSGDAILIALPVLLAFGIPTAFKSMKIASKLRGEGVGTALKDEASVPTPIALRIIRELKQAFPSSLNVKGRAQLVAHIFETVNARPPGAVLSAVFLFLQAGTFFFAVLFACFSVVAVKGDLMRTMSLAVTQPEMACSSALSKKWEAPAAVIPSEKRLTFAASFKSAAQAERLFASLQTKASPGSSLLLFGQSVLLVTSCGLEDDVSRWIADLERQKAQVVVGRNSFPLSATFGCVPPSTGKGEELRASALPCLMFERREELIPPWSPRWDTSTQEGAQWLRSRQTYTRLKTLSNPNAVPTKKPEAGQKELNDARQRLSEAYKRGDQKEIQRLNQRIGELAELERRAKVKTLLADPTVDAEMIDLAEKTHTEKDKTVLGELTRRMAERMGRIPEQGGDSSASDADKRLCAKNGWISLEGLYLRLTITSFESISDALPAIATWLENNKCGVIRYSITRGFESAEGDEDEESGE